MRKRTVKERQPTEVCSHRGVQALYEAAVKLLTHLNHRNMAQLRAAAESLEKEARFVASPEGQALRDEANDLYFLGSHELLQIDDATLISEADEGTWVQAWVWVPKQEENDLDEA